VIAPFRTRVAKAVAALALAACGQKAPPAPAHALLDGAVARIGSVTVAPSLVADVARRKGSTARAALEDLVRDALAAEGSRARGFDRDPAVAWESTAALARRVPEHMASVAAEQPPTDDELALVSVVHAVVMRSAGLREEDALALAGAIRRAVVGARSAADFEARANTVAHPHAQVLVQPIGPFGADGADATGGQLDAGFVAAAFALHGPFEMSPVIASPFGWHVIQLVERRPPDGPIADRRKDLGPAVARMRARMNVDAFLRDRRELAKVEISAAADALMAQATTPQ
jgi:parvulin-like peptidyl-prolyl isomerase